MSPTSPSLPPSMDRPHFIGIGGAGMSGIAKILAERGARVAGSDSRESDVAQALRALGVTVHIGHDAAHLAPDTSCVVVSSAIRQDNPELAAAAERGVPVVHRSDALAALMEGRRTLAVAGTHGKTTTTSMLAVALTALGLDPSYAIGGDLDAPGSNARHGAGELFVAEADESDRSFHRYSPEVAVVLNVELDHHANYASMEEIHESFATFAGRIRPGGTLVVSADQAGAVELTARLRASTPDLRIVTVGESADADVRILRVEPRGLSSEVAVRLGGALVAGGGGAGAVGGFRAGVAGGGGADRESGSVGTVGTVGTVGEPDAVSEPGTVGEAGPVGEAGRELVFTVSVPGRHYAHNAVAALAAGVAIGVPAQELTAALGRYTGVKRRLQPRGEAGGVRVVDSYAHHPTEMAADLEAMRGAAGDGRVLVVFQPHLFSRTRELGAQMGEALAQADASLVLDVYPAREDPIPGVTSALIVDAARAAGADAAPEHDRAAVPEAVAGMAKPGDLVLTMGAGDVTDLGPLLLARLGS